MVGAHRVRPECPLDISAKLRAANPFSGFQLKRANAIRPYNNIIVPMVGAHRVRPECPLDISAKLRAAKGFLLETIFLLSN